MYAIDTATVAQSCTLLYRGFSIRSAPLGKLGADRKRRPVPNAIRRYSRLEICATTSCARASVWWQCQDAPEPYTRDNRFTSAVETDTDTGLSDGSDAKAICRDSLTI